MTDRAYGPSRVDGRPKASPVLPLDDVDGGSRTAAERAVLGLQRSIGNRAVLDLVRASALQRQSQTSGGLLTPAAAAAAVREVTQRFDEDSIRTLELVSSQPLDGVFDAADAEAIARLQQRATLTPTGTVTMPLLDAMLKAAGPVSTVRSALIHLIVDHANLDTSGVLAVVFDPSLSTASARDTLPGGVGTIQIGNAGFQSYRVMVAEIRKQLAVRPPASSVSAMPAVLTNPSLQKLAIALNKNMLRDPRSIKLLQGALKSKPTGKWDVGLVRRIAAKQQALGLSLSGGILFDSTLAAIATEMIANGSEDGVLRLIVDYYNLDTSHAFNVVFDPSPTNADSEAETFNLGGVGTPGAVHVFPKGFQQPFPGLVHTVAHELGHIKQIVGGVGSPNLREFLSEGIEIESNGMPAEPIESDTDIDLLIQGTSPVHPALIQDAQRMLHFWDVMTAAEKQANHQRYISLRTIIVTRIGTDGSPTQKTKLAPFVARLNRADQGVP
jgi:peptidoglycan hydrolase-like protein with peptidoglycan-binding domain